MPRNFVGTSYYGTTAFLISKLLYTPLVTLDKDWVNIGPAIATKWEWSADNKQLTMTLRKDFKFHDGSPLTAKDVEFTYKLMVRVDTAPAVQDLSIFEGGADYKKGTTDTFAGVTVIDDYTVRFNLTSPSSVFLRNVSNCRHRARQGFRGRRADRRRRTSRSSPSSMARRSAPARSRSRAMTRRQP